MYAHSYTEVKARLNAQEIDNLKNKSNRQCGLFIFEISEEWLREIKANNKLSTYNKYRNTVEKILLPVFGKYPTTKISTEMISDFVDHLLTAGKKNGSGYSKKSATEICGVLKQIFLFSEEQYGLKLNCSLRPMTIHQQIKEPETFSEIEQRKLCNYLLYEPDLCKIGVLIALYTGIRIGELCALQWKDISFENNTLKVEKTVQRVQLLDSMTEKTKVIITEPKSSCSVRSIPLPAGLAVKLKAFSAPENYYVVSGSPTCLEPRKIQYQFKKYLKECNLPILSFHSLRHTFATRCIELGFDAKTLSEILGHSSVNITLNRYVHSSMKRKQESMNKLTIPA